MHGISRLFVTCLQSLRRNLMRSMLTCLGITIGIAAVISTMEIGQGSSQAVAQTISKLGANVLQVDPSDQVKAGVSSGTGTQVTLTPDDCNAILQECSSVDWVAPSVDCRLQVLYGNRNYSPRNILGTSPDYLTIRDWNSLEDGAAFTQADVTNAACVCLLGQTVVQQLFPDESPTGKLVRINGVSLTVVGVLSAKGANMMGMDQDDCVLAPWTTVKYRLSGVRSTVNQAAIDALAPAVVNTSAQLYPPTQFSFYSAPSAEQAADRQWITRFTDLDDVWISVASRDQIPNVKEQIRQLLRERHHLQDDQPDDFRIRDLTEISERVGSTTELMARFLLCIAGIALVVGGVGIMNIMLVSVTERTREIGLRMAVGARARDILRQFLIESVLLCLIGGVAGVALGHGASLAMTRILNWPTSPSPAAVIIAVAVSATVGIVFGYYPAWKASNLDPIDALRFE